MNSQTKTAHYRAPYAVADSRDGLPITRGALITKAQNKRIGDWLRESGAPCFSAWPKRRAKK